MLIYQIVQNFPTTQNGALLNRMPQYNNTAHLASYKSIQSAIKKKGTLQKDGLSWGGQFCCIYYLSPSGYQSDKSVAFDEKGLIRVWLP